MTFFLLILTFNSTYNIHNVQYESTVITDIKLNLNFTNPNLEKKTNWSFSKTILLF